MKSSVFLIFIPIAVLLSTFIPAVGTVVSWMFTFTGFMWITFHVVYRVNSEFWDRLAEVEGMFKMYLPDMKTLGSGSTKHVVTSSILMILVGVIMLISPIKFLIVWMYGVEASIVPRIDMLVFLLAIYTANYRFSRSTTN